MSAVTAFPPGWWAPAVLPGEPAGRPPAWAVFVADALRRPTGPRTPAATWHAAFTGVLRPLLAEVDSRLLVPAGLPVDRAAVSADVLGQLAENLVRQVARTFVAEMHRAADRLGGATPGERFDDFVRGLDLTRTLTAYPVLARILGDACRHRVDAVNETLVHLARDRPAITAKLLGTDPGLLTGLRFGGDLHHRGRGVSLLRFGDGSRIVHRPRPVDLYRRFADTVAWLNQRMPGPALRTVQVLERDGYGWIEYVTHQPCADDEAVRRFYLRQGALLALLYALDGTDVHCENLIAAADQPVLCDVETLLHPRVSGPDPAHADPAAEVIARSVCRTALLPMRMWGDDSSVDLSGLGGEAGAPMALQIADWSDPGTDRMRLIRRPATAPGGRNRPYLHGRAAEPRDHASALRAGFAAAYDTIVAYRDQWCAPDGPLHGLATARTRVVVRATAQYGVLLDESTHPELLRRAVDRDAYLGGLCDDTVDGLRPLLRHEVDDLWRGDVPIFTARAGDRALWTADGVRVPEVLPVTPWESVAAKAAALGGPDRRTQDWLITAALASRAPGGPHRPSRPHPSPAASMTPDPELLLAAACGLADDIVSRAATGFGRNNWIALELVDDARWAVLPMGAGLPYGYCGVALALAQLGRLTGTARYTETAVGALAGLPALLDSIAAEPEHVAAVGVGLAGLGGICYALARLDALAGPVPEWRTSLDIALHAMAGAADRGGLPWSYHDGLAGGLTAVLAVEQETGHPVAAGLADGFAAHLRDAARRDAPGITGPGFAHGAHGAGFALLRYGVRRSDPLATETGRRLVAPAGSGTDQDQGWCRGTAGWELAGQAAGLTPPADTRVRRRPLADLSLCHGELGAVEPALQARAAGEPGAAAEVERCARQVLGGLDRYGPRGASPGEVTTTGLFDGLAGISYGLVRLAFPDEVPAVLRLEPGHSMSTKRRQK
ncbi:type 2 lanthipeptide synthetase LanM family protein [Actinoplanes sp. NPDC026670]|uniref:type 2 lanthipeptide synthetase LanM family protein n=1 Tax=Actinoplanes sp. NPDC026670 TaxID=3154700 RepID=UPI0033C399A8